MLKIDPRNEKGLMRKLNILVELGEQKQYEKILSELEDVAFQSEQSQIVYNHIKKTRERIA